MVKKVRNRFVCICFISLRKRIQIKQCFQFLDVIDRSHKNFHFGYSLVLCWNWRYSELEALEGGIYGSNTISFSDVPFLNGNDVLVLRKCHSNLQIMNIFYWTIKSWTFVLKSVIEIPFLNIFPSKFEMT